MNNIQQVSDELDYLAYNTINILDHCSYNKYETNSFHITGMMADPQRNLGKIDLVLNINTNPSGTNQETKIICSITDINNKNYTLNCKSNEEIDPNNLQSAYSIINNDMLLLNFDPKSEEKNEEKSGDSTGENDTTDSKTNSHKSSGGLSSGGIIAIVVASIAALAAIIFIIILVKKGSTPKVKFADITNNQFSSQTNIEA